MILHALIFIALNLGNPEKVIHSQYTNKPLTIDGNFGDWKDPEYTVLLGNIADSENVLRVSSRWDEKNLYFAFDVQDKDLRAEQRDQDSDKLFLDDMVEVLFDPSGVGDSCWNSSNIVYHINILGVKKDDRGTENCLPDKGWNGKAHFAIALRGTINKSDDVDEGYSVELAVPWDELALHPKNKKVLGINFANGDNDGKGRQLFDWVRAWPMRTPKAFGRLMLLKNSASPLTHSLNR